MIIHPPERATATGHVAAMYESDLADDGIVFAHTRAMAVNPEAHAAFEALVRAVVPSIGVRVYEAATLGAARALDPRTVCSPTAAAPSAPESSTRKDSPPSPPETTAVSRSRSRS